ncbi:MAG: thioredoxin domain-containing protein [Patescibacteria group bacterium]|nr:thioredoxin domain-containing protein [Patescibacteria group bacterium]
MSQNEGFQINTPMAVLLGAIIIAGAVFLSNAKVGVPVAPAGTAGATGTTQTAPTQPQNVDATKISTANDGILGNANAPVTMVYWYDYQCPFCQRNELDTMPQLIKDYVDTGKVKIVFKDFAFLGPDSVTLGEYAKAVLAADPAQFYDWHHAVFVNQEQENTGWATPTKIRSITESVLGKSMTDQVFALVQKNSAEYQKEMDADKADGNANGVNGTPAAVIGTHFINGAVPYAQFQAAIDAALAGK